MDLLRCKVCVQQRCFTNYKGLNFEGALCSAGRTLSFLGIMESFPHDGGSVISTGWWRVSNISLLLYIFMAILVQQSCLQAECLMFPSIRTWSTRYRIITILFFRIILLPPTFSSSQQPSLSVNALCLLIWQRQIKPSPDLGLPFYMKMNLIAVVNTMLEVGIWKQFVVE